MIFYFSATGNSLQVAQKMAMTLNTEYISITDVIIKNENLDKYTFSLKKDEKIGFVIPTYFCGIPIIVDEFLSKLNIVGGQGNYVFLVTTYGAMPGNVAKMFQKKLYAQGLTLDASYCICTVDTYIPMFAIPEKSAIDKTLAKASLELEKICNSVLQKEKNNNFSSRGVSATIFTALMYPSYLKGRKTNKFSVNTNCLSCGLCENVCPNRAIKMQNGKPIWVKESCILCLGCLHRCPSNAINYGKKTKDKKRYVNLCIVNSDKYL